MIEMAKAHNLNIYKYLNYLLEHCPVGNWTDERLISLASWNQAVIETVRIIRVKIPYYHRKSTYL